MLAKAFCGVQLKSKKHKRDGVGGLDVNIRINRLLFFSTANFTADTY
jgi:hypothetical protein